MNGEELFTRHGSALLLYARQFTDSLADAEEAVQDGFVRFWRAAQDGRIRAVKSPGLLFTYVRRSALDLVRSSNRRAVREEKAAETLYDRQPTFESGLEKEERRVAIEKALAELPGEQREAVVMRIWGELSFRQIGDVLGVPLHTVASRYRYALRALRRRLPPDT